MFKLRYVVGLLGSAAITVGLFLFMRELVDTEFESQEIVESEFPKILREEIVEESKPRDPKPDRPVEKETPPTPPILDTDVTLDPSDSGQVFDFSGFNPVVGKGGFQDGRAVAIVKIPPVYPERCRSRGIEGRVLLEFDVTELGTVENVRVVESQPGTCFDKASVKAVQQWKFRPKMINSKAVPQYGVQEFIEYKFEDDA